MSRTDLRQLWTMTASDLRQRIRDRSVIIFALVVPLALMFVFNLALSGMDSMPLRARLKTNIRARGTTRAKMITDLSRIRWRRSDAVMVHSWRRSVRLMSVPQGLAGELEEDRL